MDSRGRLPLRGLFRRLRRGKPRLYRSDRSFSVSVVVERRAIQRHAVQGRIGPIGNSQPYGVHQSPGILKFLSTVQADLVRPFLDREHGSPFAVMASEGKLDICGSGFINPPLDSGVRKFHGHRANPVESARWHEPERLSNRRRRSKY
jgi:hypothetical protein